MQAAIVLCGGLGTRLRPVIGDVPKVLARFGPRTFLDYLLAFLGREGITHAVLAAGFGAEQIRQHLDGRKNPTLQVTLVVEDTPLGTGGAVKFAANETGLDEDVVVLNGDTFVAFSVRKMVARHKSNNEAVATMAVVPSPGGGRFGSVNFDPASHKISAFKEKIGGEANSWVNAGVYVFSPDVIDLIEPNRPVSLEREILPELTDGRLFAYPILGSAFLDYGTPEAYQRAQEMQRLGDL